MAGKWRGYQTLSLVATILGVSSALTPMAVGQADPLPSSRHGVFSALHQELPTTICVSEQSCVGPLGSLSCCFFLAHSAKYVKMRMATRGCTEPTVAHSVKGAVPALLKILSGPDFMFHPLTCPVLGPTLIAIYARATGWTAMFFQSPKKPFQCWDL